VPSPQKSRRLLLIKPAELMLYLTGADILAHTAVDDKVPPLLERKKPWKS
jgi:hypothetical protein